MVVMAFLQRFWREGDSVNKQIVAGPAPRNPPRATSISPFLVALSGSTLSKVTQARRSIAIA